EIAECRQQYALGLERRLLVERAVIGRDNLLHEGNVPRRLFGGAPEVLPQAVELVSLVHGTFPPTLFREDVVCPARGTRSRVVLDACRLPKTAAHFWATCITRRRRIRSSGGRA